MGITHNPEAYEMRLSYLRERMKSGIRQTPFTIDARARCSLKFGRLIMLNNGACRLDDLRTLFGADVEMLGDQFGVSNGQCFASGETDIVQSHTQDERFREVGNRG
jgi:hypothetical protein